MTNTQDISRQAPRTGPWIIAYTLSVGAAFALIGGVVTDTRIGLLLWAPVAVSAVMIVYTSWRRHRLLGTLSSAARSFWRRIVASAVLAFSGFAITGIIWDSYGRTETWSAALALLPYAGFGGIIWSVHRYIVDETDEYLRAQAVRQVLIAGFVTLMVSALWGGLAFAGYIPSGWVGLVVLIWFGGMGIGRLYNEMRP